MMKSWPTSLLAIAMTAAVASTALVAGCSKQEPATPETAEAPAANTPPAAAPEAAPAAPAASGKAEPGGYVPNEEEKVAPAPEGTAPHTATPGETKTE